MTCPSCGTANPTGARFCVECGTRLVSGCPNCGSTSNPDGARFCATCGTRLGTDAATSTAPIRPGASGHVVPEIVTHVQSAQTERRVVTVLFADLEGFTTRADGADPERIREFLASYFELAREVVERYGGLVEKFIGDAVMALWGAPVAREDDPERAVRAAMELVDSVRRLEAPGGAATALRAGVLTGEAAVTIGADGQGMVAGDLVNTASRLQSVAPANEVLVGETTVRASDRSIVFEPAGEQVLKGKSAPVPAWRAIRVVAERGGLGRSEGIEAPFVGRDDELRLLKDVLHATGRERRVRLVSVTGQAGVGKSRLAWEYLKYIDGLIEPIYWHQGRSPSFGEGVTFWALGEMVRRRAQLAESDDESVTRQRIAATLDEYVPDETERRRLEPVLLSLLGVGEAPAGGREELFAALRTFFERISIHGTTVLVFEDLQWADAGVLDFIDHLVEWSIGYPILVVTLARPELLDRRSDWGAGRRDFVALALGPLAEPTMRQLISGLVPEMPERTIASILARADGIPLYAVEMVRMLAADGRLEDSGGFYRVIGDLGDVRVPESLQSLIASRLDALDPADRALLQDGAVLGQTFSVVALASLTGDEATALEARLRALVRREVLQLDTDPRSPERGQFGFTQALVREVAYATLARRDRRQKHLAAARYYETLEDDEVAGVLATHYIDAWEAAPEGPEGEAVAVQARIALKAAADRASALGSHEQAAALLSRARSVTTDETEDTELLERMAAEERLMGRYEAAIGHLTTAVERHRASGDRVAILRSTARLGRAYAAAARTDETLPMLLAAAEEFDGPSAEVDAALVELRAALTVVTFVSLDDATSQHWTELALADAERLGLDEIVADLLVTKGSRLSFTGRWREGTALLDAGRRLAIANGLYATAARAANNAVGGYIDSDPSAGLAVGREGLELARRYGLVAPHLGILGNTIEAALPTGDLAWARDELDTIREDSLEQSDAAVYLIARVELDAIAGLATDDLERRLRQVTEHQDAAMTSAAALGLAWAAFAAGRDSDAIDEGIRAGRLQPLNEAGGLVLASRAAALSGDRDAAAKAHNGLAALGSRGQMTEIAVLEAQAIVDAMDGRWAEATRAFAEVWRRQREARLEFYLALSQLEYVAVAPAGERTVGSVAEEARTTFIRIGAAAFGARLDEVLARRGAGGPREDPADVASVATT